MPASKSTLVSAIAGTLVAVASLIALTQVSGTALVVACLLCAVAGVALLSAAGSKMTRLCQEQQAKLEPKWHDDIFDTGLTAGRPLFDQQPLCGVPTK